jgi:small-conductance mechanosensitive channel
MNETITATVTLSETTAAVDAAEATAPRVASIFDLLPDNGLVGHIFTVDTALRIIQVFLTIFLGLILVGLVVSILKRVTKKRFDVRTSGLIIKITQYLGLALIAINAFDVARVDLSALLGAAGIAGIALGFAAQTSVSNFISGFFLISEKMFAPGDVLNVDGTVGAVLSVDALSIKLRTFDNQLVRIPNETLIKTNVFNITRFPARRLNMNILITYDSDIEQTKAVLLDTVAKNRDILMNPEPLFFVKGFAENGVELLLGVWIASTDWVNANNSIHIDVKKRLDSEGIKFAFPTRTIYSRQTD